MNKGNKQETKLFWVVVVAGCALLFALLRKLIF